MHPVGGKGSCHKPKDGWMNIFKLEHSKAAYRADLALYCITAVSGSPVTTA